MIITEIKVTAKKATVKFKTKSNDPFEQSVIYDGPLDAERRSHIEAVGEHIIAKAREQMEAEDAQEKLRFDSPEEPEAEPVGGDVLSYEDETQRTDWSSAAIPLHPETDIPDFSKMEKAHLEHYVSKAGKEQLGADLEYNFAQKLDARLSVEKSRERALEVIFEELKISA